MIVVETRKAARLFPHCNDWYIKDGYLYLRDTNHKVVAVFNKFEWIRVEEQLNG